jgi:hypothetical protein
MKKMRCAFALICLLCAGPAFAESVKLPHRVRPAGMACEETKTFEVKVTAKGRTMEVPTRIRKRTVVVASSAEAVTKAKVTYSELTTPGGTGTDVIGPTYELAFDGKALSIARADGKPLADAERLLIEKDNKQFGKPDVFGKALAGIAFEKGRRTVLSPALLASWDAFPQPVEAALTLTETRASDAQFKLELKGGDPNGERIELSGTVSVERATGEPLSLVGDGTFAAKGATGTVHMVMTGTCKR